MKIIYYITFILFLSIQDACAQYQFMFLNSNPDKKELPKEMVEAHQKYHMENMSRLANEGFLLVAGPFYEKGGIFIFDPSKGNLYEKLLADSAIMNDRFILEILDYEPVLGGICPVGEDAEMVTYQFARFHPFSASQVLDRKALTKAEYLDLDSKLDLVTYARFGDRQGSILIYKGEEKSPNLQEIESVKDYGYRLEQKKLFIAKGSFCEK